MQHPHTAVLSVRSKKNSPRVRTIISPSYLFVRGGICHFSVPHRTLFAQTPQGAPGCLSSSLPPLLPRSPLSFPLPTLERKLTNGSNYLSGLRLLNFFPPSSCKDVLRLSFTSGTAVKLHFNGHLRLMSS